MKKYFDLQKFENNISYLILLLLTSIVLITHFQTFFNLKNILYISSLTKIGIYSILIFFAFDIIYYFYIPIDFLFIQIIRLSYFIILNFFTKQFEAEVFLSIFLWSFSFKLNVPTYSNIKTYCYKNGKLNIDDCYYIDSKNIRKINILSFILNIFIFQILCFYFRKNLIPFFIFILPNLIHNFIPLFSRSIFIQKSKLVPESLKDYYIGEFSSQNVTYTTWVIPFTLLFFLLNINVFSLLIFILTSIICVVSDTIILFFHTPKEYIKSTLLEIFVELGLMTFLYIVYLRR